MELDGYITAQEATEYTRKSVWTAYKIIRQINNELEEQGKITIAGQCPKKIFFERLGLV